MRSPSPPPPPSATAKMAAYLSKFSPIPAFPEYTGPYKVGTMDVEVPIDELNAPSPAPDCAADIPTVLFRIFYPATDDSEETYIPWLPNPQRHHVSAYTKFMGIGDALSEVLSFLPRHLHYTTIPAHKNARLEQPNTENGRWPTMFFSHGLGGYRNSYSYIAGSLASHGVITICPEHRDGSAVNTIIRLPSEQNRFWRSRSSRVVPYQRISHTITDEIYELREDQLRIRLWEMGLVHEAILAMDKGTQFTNLNSSTPSLSQFADKLHVHEPGSVIFAGHSFGAATMTQLLKSTYYADHPTLSDMKNPLFTPAKDSNIRKQVTGKNVTMLLDMWCIPLMGPNTAPLFNLPLPIYDDVPSAPGGSALLAVESEAFFGWREHLHMKARILSPDPTAKVVTPDLFEKPSGMKLSEPNFFYVQNSAHLNQSDFGILFPWLTKKIFDAQQPERALRLNLRSQLQFFRANGIPVARTYNGDLIDGAYLDKLDMAEKDEKIGADGVHDDRAILDRSKNNAVDHWQWIDMFGLGDADEEKKGKTTTQQVEEGEQEMKSELEPSEQVPRSVQDAVATAVPAAA